MKKNRFKILVYWKNRKATLRECTHALLDFLRKLKAYQPSFFGTWYGGGRSKKEALCNKISLTYECIKNNLSKRDKDDSYSELSYMGGTWNGKDEPHGISINTSQGKEGTDEMDTNNCIIALPEEGEIYDYFQVPAHELELVKLMIAHWKPDYICIHHYTNEILPPLTDEKLLQVIKDNVIDPNT